MKISLRLSALLCALALLSGGSEACHDSGGPQLPASVSVTPSHVGLAVNENAQLTADVFDKDGGRIQGAAVTWRSSNESVALVSSSGTVTGVTQGNASITASAGPATSVSATVTVSPPMVLVVLTNLLLRPVVFQANGQDIASVPALQTAQQNVLATGPLNFAWRVMPYVTTQGQPIGDAMSATYAVITNPVGTINLTAGNLIGGQYYFVPIMTNSSFGDWLMEVNSGLPQANRCNCLVGAGQAGVAIGYYRLYSNTIVRAYRPGSGYAGSTVFWSNVAGSVTAGSGAVYLSGAIAPARGFTIFSEPGNIRAFGMQRATSPLAAVH
jgi:hypothetical protein